jgi:type IV pilus assembly protein PilQ
MRSQKMFLGIALLFSGACFSATIQNIKFALTGQTAKITIIGSEALKFTKTVNAEQHTVFFDFPSTVATKNAMRPMDTSEFNTSVIYLSLYEKPGNAGDLRLSVLMKDDSPIDVASDGTLITLSVTGTAPLAQTASTEPETQNAGSNENLLKPKSEETMDILDNLTMSGAKQYVGKKISVNVKSVAIQEVLNMIADTSGFNILVDEAVDSKKPLTLTLTNVPWDEALDTILTINKLAANRINNILMITTYEKALAEKTKREEENKIKEVEEPMVTKIFSINYAKPSEMTSILGDYKSSDKAKITIEARTNKIIVKDTVTAVEKMKKVIELLDTANPQVLIEGKVVELNESAQKDIGFGNVDGAYNPLKRFDGQATDLNTYSNSGFVLNTIANSSQASGISFTAKALKRFGNIALRLQLYETESRGKIISSPRVLTMNNQAASITSSASTNYKSTTVSSGVSTDTWASVSVSTSLSVTPTITNNGSIIMAISVNKSGFTGEIVQNTPPNTASNSISTNVLVDNGSTVVLGGLYQTADSLSESGMPILKDIPIIGWLFRSSYKPNKSKSETMVFITPTIVNKEEAGMENLEQL